MKMDERFCRACGLPFHEGPLPKESNSFSSGNVTAVVYPAGGFRRNEYVVRIARVKGSGRGLYLSEFIPVNELDDVLSTLADLEAWIDRFKKTSQRR